MLRLQSRSPNSSDKRDSYVKRIAAETDLKAKAHWQGELQRLANPRKGIAAKYDVQLKPAQDQVETFRTFFEQERSKASTPSDDQKGIERRRDALRNQLDEVRVKWAGESRRGQ